MLIFTKMRTSEKSTRNEHLNQGPVFKLVLNLARTSKTSLQFSERKGSITFAFV